MSVTLQTAHGSLDPFAPSPGMIHPGDLAAGLAIRYRWPGGVGRSTVAQHSVECSIRLATPVHEAPELAAWGLLHDAAEAYLPDVPEPLKKHLGWLTGAHFVRFEIIEGRILRAVASRFDLPWPIPDEVLDVDLRLRATEFRDLFRGKRPPNVEAVEAEPYDVPLPRRWSAEQAEAAWLARFEAIFGPPA